MAGALERVILTQPEDLESGSYKLHIGPAAVQAVANLGVPLPTIPQTYRGEMPSVLTNLTDEELGDLLNNVNQWLSYLDGQLALADTERKTAKADLEFREARVRIAIKAESTKRLTTQDKADITTTDPRIVEAKQRDLYCESIYALLRAARNKAQQDWETVSRRITQRGQEVERIKREISVAGVPSHARTFHRPGVQRP